MLVKRLGERGLEEVLPWHSFTEEPWVLTRSVDVDAIAATQNVTTDSDAGMDGVPNHDQVIKISGPSEAPGINTGLCVLSLRPASAGLANLKVSAWREVVFPRQVWSVLRQPESGYVVCKVASSGVYWCAVL